MPPQPPRTCDMEIGFTSEDIKQQVRRADNEPYGNSIRPYTLEAFFREITSRSRFKKLPDCFILEARADSSQGSQDEKEHLRWIKRMLGSKGTGAPEEADAEVLRGWWPRGTAAQRGIWTRLSRNKPPGAWRWRRSPLTGFGTAHQTKCAGKRTWT